MEISLQKARIAYMQELKIVGKRKTKTRRFIVLERFLDDGLEK